MTLPAPTDAERTRSDALTARIHAEMALAGGWIPFSRYMALVLYEPGLGYYACGERIFGAGGDFVTAPELTPLFGRTLARALAPTIRDTGGDVLELGAGSGKLAVDLLGELARLDALPDRYRILEVSAVLAARQRDRIAAELPHLAERCEWSSELPHGLRGVIVGNEVLDALPVEVVHWGEAGPVLRGVVADGAGFAWAERAMTERGGAGADAALLARVNALGLPPGYVSELCPALPGLIASLGERLEAGAMLFVDYGFPRAEYYHPQRAMGTLRAHWRHHALDDPFFLPGLADLTAHVDFSAVAEAGVAAGLTLAGYASQAGFLIDAGIAELLGALDPTDVASYLPQANALNTLISPAEMGELFKVIAFSKAITAPLPGFARGDRRHRL